MRRIITFGLAALVTAAAALLLFSRNSAKTALEETRRALRQQGFKIDLAEFDLSASAEFHARAAALTNADLAGSVLRGPDIVRRAQGQFMKGVVTASPPAAQPSTRQQPGTRPSPPPSFALHELALRNATLMQEKLDLMRAVGSNAALVLWKQDKLPDRSGPYPWPGRPQLEEDLWPALRAAFDDDREGLDAACYAAISGPIRFDLQARHGIAMLLPHLARLKGLSQTLGSRTVLELHDGNRDAAWTNLLASSRLITAWDPEPSEISHLVRFADTTLAYDTAWQALQADGWPDDRLALLQREWEVVNFFRSLPETESFARASAARLCQQDRQEPLVSTYIFKEAFRSPRNAWYRLTDHWYRIRYRHHGSYEDERALLLYYRDCELTVRRAVQAPTWAEMRLLPGATNALPFQSKYRSRVQTLLNMRQMSGGFGGRGQSFLGRAAEAEARRRLIVTAIALQRYRGRHGGYPKTLQALVPELLPSPPVDFMDGKPLRYQLTTDGHFVLYSVGMDCVDDGGTMIQRRQGEPYGAMPFLGNQRAADLVWPRPASPMEVQAQNEADDRQAAVERATLAKSLAEAERQVEVGRQAIIEKLLAEADARKAAEPSSGQRSGEPIYQGRPLRELLRNDKTAGTNNFTLDELLTARQVTNGEYDGTAIFEVPVSYDAATNIGRLHLVVDGHQDAASRGEEGEGQTCERATNGNCLLGWTSTYDPPGRHAIQAEFIATKDEAKEESAHKYAGPAVLFVSTNLCQFDAAFDHFDGRGVTLYARLPESNGVYTIELKAPAGAQVKTLKGTTSNGVIKVHWNMIDDRGQRFTNDTLDSVFQVTLPGSGRSQKLKGP